MGYRIIRLVEGEYYHIFNRGVEKKSIFNDKNDSERFLEGLVRFNDKNLADRFENIEKSIEKIDKQNQLVEIIAYCINPNHFHIVLKQISEKGIEKFIQKLCSGYSIYYNKKNERVGPLFSGRFKSVHLNSDNKLFRTSAYVNLNYVIHNIETAHELGIVKSSWEEYMNMDSLNICNKEIILDNFNNKEEYKNFCLNIIKTAKEIRGQIESSEDVVLE